MEAPGGLLDVTTLMVHLSYITCSSCLYPFFLDVQALLICGGVYNFQNGSRPKASNKCYLLDRYSSRLFATMSEERTFAASLTYENSLWITGGLDYGQDYDNFIPFSSTGKSLSEALLFAENGENMLCTKIVLNVRNNFCTQHVLPRFELGIFMY